MSRPDAPAERSSGRPRYRYLLVQVTADPAPSRDELVRVLQTRAPLDTGLWLTRYDGSWAIIRVFRGAEQAVRDFVEAGGLPVRSVLTSGSIAGLQRKHRGARGLHQSRR